MDNKLTQLLYRKEVIEFTLQKFHNGAKINMELCDVIKDKITKDDYSSNYEYWKLKSELIRIGYDLKEKDILKITNFYIIKITNNQLLIIFCIDVPR